MTEVDEVLLELDSWTRKLSEAHDAQMARLAVLGPERDARAIAEGAEEIAHLTQVLARMRERLAAARRASSWELRFPEPAATKGAVQ